MKLTSKRRKYDPIRERAKLIADVQFEAAMKIAEYASPSAPDDQEAFEDEDQWGFLELVAADLSPTYWDDPEAIETLYRLRGRFAPTARRDHLPDLAKAARKAQAGVPDVSITPANPHYEEMVRRIER